MSEPLLFHDGRVFTGERLVEAFLVDEGRVVAAGTVESVRRAAPTGTAVESLGGHLVLPGLIDAHLHLAELARTRETFDARTADSLVALTEQLRAWAAAHPTGALVGRGWEREQFREGRDPDCEVLDRAVADRPVILYHTSGHAAVVNTAALAAAGVTRTSPDPAHGRVGRSSDGTPDGRLSEEAMRAVAALAAAAHPPDAATLGQTLLEAASFGLTTVATLNASSEEVAALRDLAVRSALPIRVRAYPRLGRLGEWTDEELRPVGPAGQFSIAGGKAFADGAFGPRTAWLSAPYADAPGEEGLPVGTEEELSNGIREAVERGLAPAVHAIGDRALARTVRLYGPWTGRTARPLRVEHAALTPPELLGELERVRPALVVQPGFLWSDLWLPARLGRSRARWAYAFRTLLDHGLRLAGSSDAPYDPLDPWRGLRASVARADPLGRSANSDPAEALPAEEAVRLYTRYGGQVLGESDLGSLEPGARADFVRTDVTDLARAVARGRSVVRETWSAGRRLYARPDRPDP